MFYHASPTGGITRLEPRISNHGIPLVYFSRKRENVLVYRKRSIKHTSKKRAPRERMCPRGSNRVY